jgi:hypothetical protein
MILGQEKLISAMLTTTSTGKRYIMATRPMDMDISRAIQAKT